MTSHTGDERTNISPDAGSPPPAPTSRPGAASDDAFRRALRRLRLRGPGLAIAIVAVCTAALATALAMFTAPSKDPPRPAALLAPSASDPGGRIATAIRKIMAASKYAHSSWGLYVGDLTSGKTIATLNAGLYVQNFPLTDLADLADNDLARIAAALWRL